MAPVAIVVFGQAWNFASKLPSNFGCKDLQIQFMGGV
jgi:hypothetical protein